MSGQVHILHQEFGGLTRVLHAKAEIGLPVNLGDPVPKTEVYDAIWDTGASGTVITAKVVAALGLKPIGAAKIFHAQGETIANVYLISLRFPGGVGFSSLRVTEGVLSGFDVLIGMDVIASGDLLITNHGGKTRLTFQCPANGGLTLLKNIAGLVSGAGVPIKTGQPMPPLSTAPASPPRPYAGTPRNAPCPCGSGKKFKLCHGGPNPPATPLPTP